MGNIGFLTLGVTTKFFQDYVTFFSDVEVRLDWEDREKGILPPQNVTTFNLPAGRYPLLGSDPLMRYWLIGYNGEIVLMHDDFYTARLLGFQSITDHEAKKWLEVLKTDHRYKDDATRLLQAIERDRIKEML